MPQIMCPNCGMTINLERRKEIDFTLIKNATEKQPRTFTELLHVTNLSRKTLSLRLKELCEKGILFKNSGLYTLNGTCHSENILNFKVLNNRTIHDKRIQASLLLISFLLLSSASGYVLATFIIPKETIHEPLIIGNFTMALDVNNVQDLYAWQVVITFNSSEMKVLKILSGSFLELEYPFFLNSTDSAKDMLLLGGTLIGNVPGKSGSGRLATIIFGCYVEKYEEPRIALKERFFETYLINSKGAYIPTDEFTLMLYRSEN